MTKVRVKGIKEYLEPKTGRVYVYHRKTGIRLRAPIGTPEFFAELASAEARINPQRAARPGSLKVIIQHYRESHEFAGLRPSTRKEYNRILNHLSAIDTLLMVELTAPDIVRIRDNILKRHNRSLANKTLAVLSILFSYAVERGFADSNSVRLVKKIRKRENGARKN